MSQMPYSRFKQFNKKYYSTGFTTKTTEEGTS